MESLDRARLDKLNKELQENQEFKKHDTVEDWFLNE
jgi:hypothetical protein